MQGQRTGWVLTLVMGLLACSLAARQEGPTLRVFSWNVSGRSPVTRADDFRGHLRLAAPDVVLLDEVDGTLSEAAMRDAFGTAGSHDGWQLLWGVRGGRQRIVIAARRPLTELEAFQRNAYPAADVDAVLAAAPADQRDAIRADLGHGVPVNAATLQWDRRRLLLVAMDLQCCGGGWQERRRLAEVRYIRSLVAAAIHEVRPDGVILAGDFNLASPPPATSGIGALPLVVLSGPYPSPIDALLAAEAMQRDGQEWWTINGGEQSPFPFLPFDFQLHSPHSLRASDAYVMDTADYTPGELATAGLSVSSSRTFSEHRPVVVTYSWTRPR